VIVGELPDVGDTLNVRRCASEGSGDPGADVGQREGGVEGELERVNADMDLSIARVWLGDWAGEAEGEIWRRDVVCVR
jgi:hypothetical protein